MNTLKRRKFLKNGLAIAGTSLLGGNLHAWNSGNPTLSRGILSVGCAKREITPAIGDIYTGDEEFGGKVKEIDGQLLVRVVYLCDSRGHWFILAMADTEGFTHQQDVSMRSAMAKAAGIPFENVRLNSSHNHTAPKTYMRVNEILETYKIPFADKSWVRKIESALADAALEAKDNAREVVVSGGAARVSGIAANRTVYLENGTATTRFGYKNPEEVRNAPEGLIDPHVIVLRFTDTSGKPVVTIFNYACHATSVGRRGELVSPDFPGYASEVIERETGGMAFFLQGACGNVGTGKYADGSLEESKKMGTNLAEGVFKALENPFSCRTTPLSIKTWKERIQLDPKLPTLENAKKELERLVSAGVRNSSLWLWAALLEVIEDKDQSSLCDMFLLYGGDWCLAGLPAESFIESALAIKSASPFPLTMVGAYYMITHYGIYRRVGRSEIKSLRQRAAGITRLWVQANRLQRRSSTDCSYHS